jgi:hypothetical protein
MLPVAEKMIDIFAFLQHFIKKFSSSKNRFVRTCFDFLFWKVVVIHNRRSMGGQFYQSFDAVGSKNSI